MVYGHNGRTRSSLTIDYLLVLTTNPSSFFVPSVSHRLLSYSASIRYLSQSTSCVQGCKDYHYASIRVDSLYLESYVNLAIPIINMSIYKILGAGIDGETLRTENVVPGPLSYTLEAPLCSRGSSNDVSR